MRFLLIDNSNSRTKFILADENGLIGDILRISTTDVCPELLDVELEGWSFEAVLIGSVVPMKAAMMENYFKAYPIHFLKHDSPHGIQIDSKSPEQIGADRIANVVGVEALFSSPAIVIDFGTAVTFDVIASGARYIGGVIAPGLGSMNDYLHGKTALLPEITIEEPDSAIGGNTVEAMQSGAVYGYRGLVRGILDEIVAEMGEEPMIISTGGDGRVIADGINRIDHFSQNITLEGLRHIAVRVFSVK